MAQWQFVSRPADEASLYPRYRVLLDLLEKYKGRPVDFYDIATETGYAKSGISNALYDLQKSYNAVKCIPQFKTVGGKKKIDYLMEYSSIKNWISNLRPGPHTKTSLYIFCKFHDYFRKHTQFKDPQELIENALNGTIRNLDIHVQLAKEYAMSLRDVMEGTRQKHYDRINSFYLHNHCKLPDAPLRYTDPDNLEISVEDFQYTNFLTMAKSSVLDSRRMDALWKAITLNMIQTGMDDSTFASVFNFFAFPQIVKHYGTDDYNSWDEDKVPIRIFVQRQKTQVKYYTFIDHDGVATLKKWLNVRFNRTRRQIKIYPSMNKKYLDKSDPIFFTHSEAHPIKPYFISFIFREAGKDAGVNVSPGEKVEMFRGAKIRYPFHSHESRDNLRSLAHKCRRDVEAEFFIGHEIDKYGYDKSPWTDFEWYRDSYSMLSPYLNFLSVDAEKLKLQQENNELEEKDSRWYLKFKKQEDDLAKVKRLTILHFQLEDETNPKKVKDLTTEMRELMAQF